MALKEGDLVPNFLAKDIKSQLFDSQSVIGKKAVVIYFYPKDDTSQCTVQACGFRDNFNEFLDNEIELIGISSDQITEHQKFTDKYNLPFVLLSDPDNAIRELFGVPTQLFGLLPGRFTYFINEEGVIQKIFNSIFGMKHVLGVLNEIKNSL